MSKKREQFWFEEPGAKAWLDHVAVELAPKVDGSATAVVVYNGKVDPKIAVELGYMILLDKPIMALVTPGMKVPRKLAAVVDSWVEGEMDDTPGTGKRVAEGVNRMLAELEETGRVARQPDPRWPRLLEAARQWRATGTRTIPDALMEAIESFDEDL